MSVTESLPGGVCKRHRQSTKRCAEVVGLQHVDRPALDQQRLVRGRADPIEFFRRIRRGRCRREPSTCNSPSDLCFSFPQLFADLFPEVDARRPPRRTSGRDGACGRAANRGALAPRPAKRVDRRRASSGRRRSDSAGPACRRRGSKRWTYRHLICKLGRGRVIGRESARRPIVSHPTAGSPQFVSRAYATRGSSDAIATSAWFVIAHRYRS